MPAPGCAHFYSKKHPIDWNWDDKLILSKKKSVGLGFACWSFSSCNTSHLFETFEMNDEDVGQWRQRQLLDCAKPLLLTARTEPRVFQLHQLTDVIHVLTCKQAAIDQLLSNCTAGFVTTERNYRVSNLSFSPSLPLSSLSQQPWLSANSWWADDRVTKTATYTRCRWPDLTCLSMDVLDCIATKCAKTLQCSKRLTARFATWKPANWHENQIEIRSKTLLIPQTCAHAQNCSHLTVSRGVLHFDYRTHVPH